MTDRSANLEDLSQRLAEVQDTLAEANSALSKWEDKVAAHNSLGPAAKDPKHVEKIKVNNCCLTPSQPRRSYQGDTNVINT